MGIKIKKIKERLPVYDLTVERNHNFYANDFLVHNCSEIVQYSDEETTAICTLTSQILKNYVKDKKFDFDLLHTTTRSIVRALNKVIDINAYSTEKGRKGGLEQRALGIGVQGMADALFLLDLVYTSEEGRKLNKDIFETIYHAALMESCELVKTGQYEKYKYFDGSPYSQGIFQFDMWGVNANELSGMWDWEYLRENIKTYGLCNSLITTAMPTASSAKISDCYEMYQMPDSNLFNRRVLGGEYVIMNKYMVNDFEKIGIWSEELKNQIIVHEGSIQNINFNHFLDPEEKGYEKKVKRIEFLLKKYKTIWETSQKELIEMSADRGVFIDQSQSMNIYIANPTLAKMTSALFYSFEKGCKTGNYYFRTKAISTGAKHLAIDLSLMPKTNVAENIPIHNVSYTPTKEELETIEMNGRIAEETAKGTTIQKPETSQFECFGCSS